MRIHREAIGTIAVFVPPEGRRRFWDWGRGTDSNILSLKAHRFVTWNQRQTVDLSVVVRVRQKDKQSVSPLSP